MTKEAVNVIVVVALAGSSAPAAELKPEAERIKAFCVDFNWGQGGPNGFAPPGMYAQASPAEHLEWYRELGVNTIQTFCVNCCGYAWFRSEVAPVQPGMKGDFLKEITELGHKKGMRVMGYFCVGANTYWGRTHPELSYGTPSLPHIPFTTEYLDYLCATIKDALTKTAIDGFMIDWVFNLNYKDKRRERWLDCEKQMFAELMGEPFPGEDKLDAAEETRFHHSAVERCWKRIRDAAKSVKPDCIIWLSCHELTNTQVAGSKMFREVDWLMNEHPDPTRLESVRKIAGPHTKIIQCLCGWGLKHDAARVIGDPRYCDVGFYGFAMPDAKTTFPPAASDNPRLAGNARNIEIMRKAFRSGQQETGSSAALSGVVAELSSPSFTYGPAEGLGHEEGVTRRDPSDVIKVGSTYYVWYTKTPHGHSGYNATVWYATSPDGTVWVEKGEALPRGGAGAWDEASVFTPNILVAKGRYYLFYTAIPKHEVLDTTPTAIGAAVAGSPNGPWQRLEENPILVTSENAAHFDSFRVDDACLLLRDGRYWLYYKGRQQGRSPAETKMGVAIADEPAGPYIRYPRNPIVDSGHEVLIWPYGKGVATLIGWAGPQKNTLQYADDALHFVRCAGVRNPPVAPGAYRPDAFTDTKAGQGFHWGIAMKPKPRPHLIRYEYSLRGRK